MFFNICHGLPIFADFFRRCCREDVFWTLADFLPMPMFSSMRTTMPSLAPRGPSNVMNILALTLLVLEGFQNIMNIPKLMVGSFLVQKLGKCMEL